MDITTAVGSVLGAFGLSGAAGLNAWLPVFVSALLDRLDVVELAAPFDKLGSDLGLVVLATLLVADFVGDKIPAVDHVLHAAGTVVHPVAGAAVFAGPTVVETDIPTTVAIVLGALTAGSVHAGRATIRPASTATTGGIGNPLLSAIEDAVSLLLTVLAFVIPVLAALLLAALAGALLFAGARLRRLFAARR